MGLRNYILILLATLSIMPLNADEFYSVQNGNWETASTWGGTVPGGNDVVYIEPGHNVQITNPSLTYENPMIIVVRGGLEFDNGKLNLPEGSTVIIENGGVVYGNGVGNNDKIRIGNTGVWTTNDGPQTGYLVWGVPVELKVSITAFEIANEPMGVQMAWKVDNVQEGDYFEIERSSYGEIFHTVSRVEARAHVKDYTYTDNASEGSYYRLRQYNAGKELIATSKIIKMKQGVSDDREAIQVYPNPSVGGMFNLEGVSEDIENIRLMDMHGRPMPLTLSTVSPGNIASRDSLSPGHYVLVIPVENDVIHKRLTVR